MNTTVCHGGRIPNVQLIILQSTPELAFCIKISISILKHFSLITLIIFNHRNQNKNQNIN